LSNDSLFSDIKLVPVHGVFVFFLLLILNFSSKLLINDSCDKEWPISFFSTFIPKIKSIGQHLDILKLVLILVVISY